MISPSEVSRRIKMASSMSWEAAVERLRKLRDEQHRNSEEVVSLWEEVLCANSYKLGNENLYTSLRTSVPQQYESEKITRAGSRVSGKLIRKRKIAILKAQDNIREAIRELNGYVEKFMSDYEAWMELCDLYLVEQDYTKAAFCLEELIMSNPHSHLYHQKYAEIKYTQGGVDNMCTARKYFAQALKLNPGSMRALYGLFLSASNVASSKSKDAKTKRDNTKYAAWAAEQISKEYKNKQSRDASSPISSVSSVEHLLDELQITQG